jgi:hypothetical protein
MMALTEEGNLGDIDDVCRPLIPLPASGGVVRDLVLSALRYWLLSGPQE